MYSVLFQLLGDILINKEEVVFYFDFKPRRQGRIQIFWAPASKLTEARPYFDNLL